MRYYRIVSIIGIIYLCFNGVTSSVSSTEGYLLPSNIETFDLEYNQWHDINSITSIGANYVIEWNFTTSNPNVLIQLWAMDDPNFNDWKDGLTPSLYKHLISSRAGASGYYSVPNSEIWHVVFMNFDITEMETTTINTDVNFIEKPTQNDGGIGQDAGNSYSTSSQLTVGNFSSSGILIYDDLSDFYNFEVEAGDNLTITFSDFGESICDFVLYKQGGTKVIEETDVIDNISMEYSVNDTGTCALGISKSNADDFTQVDYQFSIFKQSELTFNFPIEVKYILCVFSFLGISVVIVRKRKKERY